ncbi:MAG: hypothetical protein J6T73_07500 [Clostridia bacterium]|nr:hypothetical protein [Clostridia bacterium]
MKKTVVLFCIFAMLFTLCACGDSSEKGKVKSDAKTVSASETKTETEFDFDLTKLSTTVAYSQVSNMWQSPDNYMGKKIKISGTFNVVTDNGRNYYSCNIGDATACCTVFLEFVLKDDLKYPDEYPKTGEEITVLGEFETYLENGHIFCQLKDAAFC